MKNSSVQSYSSHIFAGDKCLSKGAVVAVLRLQFRLYIICKVYEKILGGGVTQIPFWTFCIFYGYGDRGVRPHSFQFSVLSPKITYRLVMIRRKSRKNAYYG
jgi:hypothetical protein